MGDHLPYNLRSFGQFLHNEALLILSYSVTSIILLIMNTQTSNTETIPGVTPRVPLVLLLLGICALLDQKECQAQGTVYTSRSAFTASINGSTTITFETLSPSSPSSIGTSPITDSGVAFTNAESRLFITSPATGIYPVPGTGQYLWNFDSSYPVGIFLPGGVTAFGADFSGGILPQTSFQATLTATLANGQSYSYGFSGPLGSFTFFGVSFSDPISSLIYSDGGQFSPGTHEEMLDNVTFGTAVPEPNISLLALFGLIASFGILRLKNFVAHPLPVMT